MNTKALIAATLMLSTISSARALDYSALAHLMIVAKQCGLKDRPEAKGDLAIFDEKFSTPEGRKIYRKEEVAVQYFHEQHSAKEWQDYCAFAAYMARDYYISPREVAE